MDEPRIEPGCHVVDRDGAAVGRVDAVFADYLLVRSGFPPVDVHVPTTVVRSAAGATVQIDASKDDVRTGMWDRPPMRPHDRERRSSAGDAAK